MVCSRRLLIPIVALFICSSLIRPEDSDEASRSEPSIYEVLEAHRLPMGLLPKGVKNFSVDDSGKFKVHLDRACNAKFENVLHYDMIVSGVLRLGQITELSGVCARVLFLWLPVTQIRVDIPSSGLIYFNVGAVSRQFSLSFFETPRDCLDAPGLDLQIQSGNFQHELDQDKVAIAMA